MIIYNGTIITWESPNRILEGQAIAIEAGKIRAIAPYETLIADYPSADRLDAQGQIIMPGNICSHTHFYGAFSRGMAIPGPAAKDFPEILKKLWWPLDRALTEEGIKYSALPCLVDAIRHGTTTLHDHHASQNQIDGSLDIIGDAVRESGIRASLCYEVTDRDGKERSKAGIRENLRFYHTIKQENRQNPPLAATFGLHASLTLSEETLEACRAAIPEDIGVHIHVAEHTSDQFDSLEKSGLRVVDRLLKHQLLGKKTIVVHAVHVDAREIQILAESGAWVTHQPRSNMNNAVGLPDIESMLRQGIKVSIGNDGFSNTMWDEWKTTYLAHKLYHRDPRWASGDKVIQMGAYHGAELASEIFGRKIGVIEPGAEADIILVDYKPNTPMTSGNLPWHILFGFNESMITTTIVAGKKLMKDRRLLTLDEEKIMAEARRIAPIIWEKYDRNVQDYK